MAWNKDDWQTYNMRLAARFHIGLFQSMPDKHSGDGGLEGFSKDVHAVGYQCYVPDDDAERTLSERIIDKINKDTLKLKKNLKFFSKSLCPFKLKRWTLLVPKEHFRDRAIVEQAGKRAGDVKSWNLPFIDDDFCITVSCGDEFDDVREEFRKLGQARINIKDVAPTTAEQQAWEESNAAQMPILDDKLNRSKSPKDAIKMLRNELIKRAVIAQNAFSRLKTEDPDGWEILVDAKAEKSSSLVIESTLNTAIPAVFIQKVINDYHSKVLKSMPSVTEEAARILTNEAVVEWLLTCPLQFYAQESNAI